MLYQVLAGRVPYETGSLTELALRQQEGEPEPLELVNPDVPRAQPRGRAAARGGSASMRYRAPRRSATRSGRPARARLGAPPSRSRPRPRGVATAATRVARRRADATRPHAGDAARPGAGRSARGPAAAPRARARRRAPAQAARARRGAFARFIALVFLFLLIATVVATLVILNLDNSQAQDFEHVVTNRVEDQIDGIRDLIDRATGN